MRPTHESFKEEALKIPEVREELFGMKDLSSYKILYSSAITRLEANVTEHMKEGWLPHGNLVTAGINFYQAIIR